MKLLTLSLSTRMLIFLQIQFDCCCAAYGGQARASSLDQQGWPIIHTKNTSTGQHFHIYDQPIPDSCFAEQHLDLDGSALRWGHKPAPPVKSAAECCRCAPQQLPGYSGFTVPAASWLEQLGHEMDAEATQPKPCIWVGT